MRVFERYVAVLIPLLLVGMTACASDSGAVSSVDSAAGTTPSSLSAVEPDDEAPVTASTEPAHGVGGESDESADERATALGGLAIEMEADPECVANQFSSIDYDDLHDAGIRPDGIGSYMWHRVLSDGESPLLEPLMLATSLCSDHFRQLAHDDMGDLLPPEEIDCVVDVGKTDPNVVAVLMLGTRDGASVDEAYPPETAAKMRLGFEAWTDILETMRALGECPR